MVAFNGDMKPFNNEPEFSRVPQFAEQQWDKTEPEGDMFDDFDPSGGYDPYCDDGQPDEYTEWQDYMGGDDWDHGQCDYE